MMFTQAAWPAPTRSWASAVASKSPGSVVRASTKSLIPLFSPCTGAENLIQRMRTMADAESLRDAAPRTPRPRRHPRSMQEVRDRRRRILTWLLSAGLAVLLVNSIVGENGYLATVQAEREQRRLEAELART